MRLLAEQINEENIPGDVAELGVFKGDFAGTAIDYVDQRLLYRERARYYRGYFPVNSTQFHGPGKAVKEFCRERKLLPVPICDLHDSVLLRKG